MTEILPEGAATPADMAALQEEVLHQKEVAQTLRKQRSSGVWGGNMLGVAPAKAQGIKDVGTIAQYRHLLEMGVPKTDRAFRLTERVLFRLLSRDDDPALIFEYQKAAKTNAEVGPWARQAVREAATAALAQGGFADDPRVRGAAHGIASNISQFLRGELVEKPIVRKGSRNILHPDAHPPTMYSVTIIAYMATLQRERAGFVERLAHYLAKPAPKRTYVIQVGRKVMKPSTILLGDPLKADSSGNPKDLPLALHWIELLARMGMLHTSSTAQRILARLLKDCDEVGVWSPKNLRAIPKSTSRLADFAYPLESETGSVERRKSDVTFRLALVAKLLGWGLEYV